MHILVPNMVADVTFSENNTSIATLYWNSDIHAKWVWISRNLSHHVFIVAVKRIEHISVSIHIIRSNSWKNQCLIGDEGCPAWAWNPAYNFDKNVTKSGGFGQIC